jgi:hypothetical protein
MAKGGKKGKKEAAPSPAKGKKVPEPEPEPEPEPKPEPEPASRGGKTAAPSSSDVGDAGLLVTVVECKGLAAGAGAAVYVRLTMADEKKQSSSVADGGAAPRWPDKGEKLLFTQSAAPSSLVVEVVEEAKGKGKGKGEEATVGSAEIALANKGKGSPGAAWDEDQWYDLQSSAAAKQASGKGKQKKDSQDKAVGQVHLILHWSGATAQEGGGSAQEKEGGGGSGAKSSASGSGSGANGNASADYESMTPQQLKDECRRAGLSPDGLKEELVRRLQAAAQAATLDSAGGEPGAGQGRQDAGAEEEEEEHRGDDDAEEGDPPAGTGVGVGAGDGAGAAASSAAPSVDGAIKAEMSLDMTLPESEVGRNALEADFIREMAAKMGIDPSRIKITAIEQEEED